MDNTEVIQFGDQEPVKVSAARRMAAEGYVHKALALASKDAIDFQRALVQDGDADPSLRFKASEAILDRFVGKAAQELRVETHEAPRIVFDPKLAGLKKGMETAVDAAMRYEGVEDAFVRAVTDKLVDDGGVTI